MADAKLSWLLEYADKLSVDSTGAVDIAGILRQLEIGYRTVNASDGLGELHVTASGKFFILIKSPNGQFFWGDRERFTAAHELAHVLLIKKWNYRPSKADSREYFYCEHLCNRFAGRILLPRSAVAAIEWYSGSACLDGVQALAVKYSVSRHVTATEIIESYNGVAICSVDKGKQLLNWGVSSIGKTRKTRRRSFKKMLPDIALHYASQPIPVGACLLWLSEKIDQDILRDNTEIASLSIGEDTDLVAVILKKPPTVGQ